MKTIIAILTLLLTFLATYDEIAENTPRLISLIPSPIMLLIKIIVIILLICWIAYFLFKKINSKSKNEFKECDKIPIEYRNMIFDTFNKIITKIETSHLPAGDIVLKHFNETDEIERIVINKSNEKFSDEFRKIYKQYKKPRDESVLPDIWVYPYNLDSKKFAEHPEYHVNGINNGKELAKYNIQRILNFLK